MSAELCPSQAAGLATQLDAAKQRVTDLENALAAALGRATPANDGDAAPGAVSRAALVSHLRRTSGARTESGSLPTLLVVSLGRFPFKNESLEHAVADEVYMEVTSRLEGLAGGSNVVARVSEHEFAIVVGGADADAALRLAVGAIDMLATRIAVGEYTLWLEASVGIRFGSRGQSAEDHIRDAALAAAHAGEKSHDRIQVFVPAMLEMASQQVQMIADLHTALANDELDLYYQPVVDLGSGRILGVEALVRWNHPRWGHIQPAAFLPAAEQGGLMVPLGKWVLGRAVWQLQQWAGETDLDHDFKVHVNLSPGEIQRWQLVAELRGLLRRHDVPANRIALEITESAVLSDSDHTAKILLGLRKLGVGLEIDDFGTGYSSISYLRNLPVDTAKVDRSLVSGLANDPRQLEFVAAILMLIKAARLQVVAEGIETPEQADLLYRLGCRKGQGFLYSKPVPAIRLSEMLTGGLVFRSAGAVSAEPHAELGTHH
jgi:diguanylate cyclase